MAMSKKHYIQVAKILNDKLTNTENLPVQIVVKLIATDLASMFKHDNAAFNKQRFLDACGLVER